jgi:hypothetical protein
MISAIADPINPKIIAVMRPNSRRMPMIAVSPQMSRGQCGRPHDE